MLDHVFEVSFEGSNQLVGSHRHIGGLSLFDNVFEDYLVEIMTYRTRPKDISIEYLITKNGINLFFPPSKQALVTADNAF